MYTPDLEKDAFFLLGKKWNILPIIFELFWKFYYFPGKREKKGNQWILFLNVDENRIYSAQRERVVCVFLCCQIQLEENNWT
jgi:hypothetical protein